MEVKQQTAAIPSAMRQGLMNKPLWSAMFSVQLASGFLGRDKMTIIGHYPREGKLWENMGSHGAGLSPGLCLPGCPGIRQPGS